MDERAIHTVETKSEHLTDNNGTFCCVPTALYRLVSLDVSGDGRKARNDSDKHAEMFMNDKQFIRTFLSVRTALVTTQGRRLQWIALLSDCGVRSVSIMKKSTARFMNNNHHRHVHIVLRIHTKVPSCRFHVFDYTQRVARNYTQRVARLNGFLSQLFDRAISLAHVRSPGMYQHAVAHPHINIISDLWWSKPSYTHPYSPQ